MTELLKLIFDAYSRQARLFPALLALVPSLVVIGTLWPHVVNPTVLPGLIGLAAMFGVLYALASFARSCGKRTEKRLLKEWGTWRTTIWLRHRSDFVQAPTLARYHKFFADHVPDWVRPTAADEQSDPAKADSYYASAVDWLKEQCRGPSFPLVEKELAEYGYRRNLRGLRATGIALGVIGIALAVAVTVFRDGGQGGTVYQQILHWLESVGQSATGGAILFNIVTITAWLGIVNDDWVRESGDQYARALLANCDGAKTISNAPTNAGAVATHP